MGNQQGQGNRQFNDDKATIDQKQINQQEIGVPHIENQYWKMLRLGKTRSLTNAFKESLIDCFQIIVPTSGHTILHQSITLDRKQIFKLCQIYGADWDQKDKKGVTPLMKAVALNRQFFAQKLIQLGADLKIKDQRGMTALDYAKLYENYQILDMLEEKLQDSK